MRCYVSGRVQGVFFRRGARDHGNSHGLVGWVKNLDDGRLELMICGEEDIVEKMVEWLWEGPAAAKVENVEKEKMPWEEFSNFEVKY